MLRVGDRLFEVLALIGTILLVFFLLHRWQSLSPASLSPAPRGEVNQAHGLAVGQIQGPSLELQALDGQKLYLRGSSAVLLMPELGPLRINLGPSALQVHGVEARFGQAALRIRADRCKVDRETLLFSGAVRLDSAEGRGLLFTDRLELSLEADRLSTGPMVILSPEGDSGGMGGRVVQGFSATLAEVQERSR